MVGLFLICQWPSDFVDTVYAYWQKNLSSFVEYQICNLKPLIISLQQYLPHDDPCYTCTYKNNNANNYKYDIGQVCRKIEQ